MQFFKFEGLIKDEAWVQENENRRVMREKTRTLSIKIRSFNERQNNECFFYIVNASDDTLTAGIINNEEIDLNEQIKLFLATLSIELNNISVEEITFNTARILLQTASRNEYINDDDEVLERFDLDKLSGRYCSEINYGENLIEEKDRKIIYNRAEQFLMKETLIPELDRIYAGKAINRVKGHPVHYMVQTDDVDMRRDICRLLLQALYANKRLHNKRYCFIDFCPGERFSTTVYDQLYKSNSNGAVIVRYLANNDMEDEYADCERDTIEKLCEVMKKYRNSVLTVFCLPRECTRSKDTFYENLGSTSIIELKEEFVSEERAESFLKMLAKEQDVRTDKRLFAKLDNDKGYLAPDLRSLFDEWYNSKLKTGVFPQYKDITTVNREVIKAMPKGTAYDELNQMIGLDEAKKVINQALNYYKAQKLFSDMGMKTDHPAMHMVFTGNPGTAKTTVARLFARIMKENSLLSKGNLIEVGRGDLVGKYVGWTAPTIQKKFREAKGSVLFIDEAYSLVDDRNGSFGDEAINTIVQEMENHREDVVVIFAGYPDKMEGFLQKNPGLRSRIAYHVPFNDYNTESLCKIAELIASQKGLRLTKGACDKLALIFDNARIESDFGNGRYVRNVIEKARMAQATRLLSMNFDSIDSKEVATIHAEDIEQLQITAAPKKKRIGFFA